jgi:probable HAF family extracellular repeat protein
MKSRTLTLFPATVLFAALTFTVQPAAQEQQQQKAEHRRYKVIDLGTLGGTSSFATGINNKGWVVGTANLLGDKNRHDFLWIEGRKIDLGTLGGPNSDEFANGGPNERGQVVGRAETSRRDPNMKDFCFFGTGKICRAFLWQNGVMTDLGTLGGNNSSAFDINNRGQVVGGAENKTQDSTCTTHQFQFRPFIWEKGEIQELPTFADDPDAFADGINDHGQAVGASGNCTNFATSHALLWQDGTPRDLGNLGGSMGNQAIDVNNEGQVVGFSDLPGDTTNHAFLWQNGVMTDLGTGGPSPAGLDFRSAGFGINEEGLVVGGSCNEADNNCRAGLWQNGVMTDLNTLIPAGSPLYLCFALGINDRGEIVGVAMQKRTGEFHAFLATPVR